SQIGAQMSLTYLIVCRMRVSARSNIEKHGADRLAKLTIVDRRRVVRMVTSGKVDTALQVTKELKDTTGIEASDSTVRTALKETGLKASAKKKKLRLLLRQIREPMDFALRHQHWTVGDWKRVIWSDETKINHLGSDGYKWVWRKPGDGLTERDVQGTV